MITKDDVKKYKELFGDYIVPLGTDKKPISLPFNVEGETKWCWKRNPNTNEFIKYPEDKLIGAEGLGVSLEPSNLIVADGDMIETSPFMSELPDTYTTGKKLNGKTLIRQKLYKSETRPKAISYGKDTDDGCCVELLVNGQSKLLGADRIVIDNRKPTVLNNGALEDVQETIRKIYAWSMLSKHYPKANRGKRDEYIFAVAGTLAKQTDWSVAKQKEFVLRLLHSNGDTKEVHNRINKVERQIKKVQEGGEVVGLPTLTKLCGANKQEGLPFIDALKPLPKPKRKEIKTLKLGEFLAKQYPKDFYLLFPLVATEKIVQVYASAGVGKTWFCLEMASAIANGLSFLKYNPHQDGEPNPVLYVEGEMGANELQRRLQLIQERYLNKGLKFNYKYFEIALLKEQPDQSFESLTTPVGRQQIENTAQRISKETGKKPIVFLDNITALTVMQEKEGADWVELVQWMSQMRARGFAIFFLHHSTKENTSASGSNVKERAIDMSIKLSKPKPEQLVEELDQEGNTQILVEFDKWREWNFTKYSKPFIANLNRASTTWSVHPILTQSEQLVKKLLDAGDEAKEIVEKLKDELSKSQIYKIIKNLKREGGEDEKKDKQY